MRRERAPLITFATAVLVAVVAFGWYAVDRQRIADQRYERQRDAICKVLASLPGRHPLPSIEHLRKVEARPGHPSDCYPIARSSRSPSAHAAAPTPRTVLIFPTGQSSPRPAPSPASSHPSSTSTPKPHPTGTPTPSPSPTCSNVHDVAAHPIRCLHL